MIISPRRALVPAAILALGLIISGCSSTSSGSDAAVVGESRITNEQLESDVSGVLVAQGKATNTSDAQLVTQTLNWLIVMSLRSRNNF